MHLNTRGQSSGVGPLLPHCGSLVAVAISLVLILSIDNVSCEHHQPRPDLLWALRGLHIALATLHSAELSKDCMLNSWVTIHPQCLTELQGSQEHVQIVPCLSMLPDH